MNCRQIARFFCVYMIAKNEGFNIGHIDVSCEHCLSRFLASFRGKVIYKKRFRSLPDWKVISPILKKTGEKYLKNKGVFV